MLLYENNNNKIYTDVKKYWATPTSKQNPRSTTAYIG